MCLPMYRRCAAAVVTALFISACGSEPTGQGAGGGAPGELPPMEVKTVLLEPKPIPQSSEFVATIRSLRSTTVQPQVEGIVRQVFIRAGDRVGAGQPLIQIDPDKQQATNTVTESQRASREADLALDRKSTRLNSSHSQIS